MSTMADAKASLLRALEQLDAAERDLDGGEADSVDLVIVYSIGRDLDDEGGWHEIGGWVSTSGPKWMHAAMLRHAARAQDETYAQDDDEDDQ